MIRRAEPARRIGSLGWTALSLAAGALAAGALAAANRLIAMTAGETYSVLGGEEGRFAWQHGGRQYDIRYVVRGRGAPLLLVHGIYAGASSFEYRRVFEPLSEQFRVYALDLLGFGLSARPALRYAPALYIQLLQDFSRQVMGAADHPVTVVASTLSGAYAVRAAAEQPDLYARLVLIEPVGLETRAAARANPLRQAACGALRSPVLGQALYNLVASRASIRYFLRRQVYANPAAVTPALVDYYHTAAHQPGARYAPASFISGLLDTPIATAYAGLTQPILLIWGARARLTPLDQARGFRQRNPHAEIRVFDCGALPQDEMPEEFAREVGAWLRRGAPSRRQR
ncbi:MAG TPA: alpha/beta fold hydrolase, partial [Ktedonobacterales bacterium]